MRAGAAAAAADRVRDGDGAAGTAVTSTAGGTPAVAEPAIDVAVKYNGAYVPPGAVWVTFTGSGTGGSCSDEWKNIPVAGTELVSGVTNVRLSRPVRQQCSGGRIERERDR